MSRLTTDPNDPRLGRGTSTDRVPQNEAHLILPDEERTPDKFVRPVRLSYQHVGIAGPKYPLRDLTDEEKERHAGCNYVKFEQYPESELPRVGSYWTQARLDAIDKGCGGVTSMPQAIAETYAKTPSFYGSTYCVHCSKYLPVAEFVWDGTAERVGS